MKKEMLFILIVFLLPTVLGIEINLKKDIYYPQETLQAVIEGSFIFLKYGNVLIYEVDGLRPEALESDLFKYDGKYYFYAVLPNKTGNFSLRIEEAKYLVGGNLKEEDISLDFVIDEATKSYLRITPGFVLTEKDFDINVKSYLGSQDIVLEFDGRNEKKELSLDNEEEGIVKFLIGNLVGDYNIKIGDYNVPVFIPGKEVVKTNDSNGSEIIPPKKADLKFVPETLEGKVKAGENYFFKILLENLGDNLTNIKFSNDLEAVIEPEILNLEKNEIKVVNITIPIPGSAKDNVSGEIKISSEDDEKILPVFFEISDNNVNVNINGTSITGSQTCSEMDGNKCKVGEECSVATTSSLDGACCLGECKKPEEPSNAWRWVVGIILILAIIGIVFYLYKKSKSGKGPKSSEDILKGRQDRFKQRMGGEEVQGGLKRV